MAWARPRNEDRQFHRTTDRVDEFERAHVGLAAETLPLGVREGRIGEAAGWRAASPGEFLATGVLVAGREFHHARQGNIGRDMGGQVIGVGLGQPPRGDLGDRRRLLPRLNGQRDLAQLVRGGGIGQTLVAQRPVAIARALIVCGWRPRAAPRASVWRLRVYRDAKQPRENNRSGGFPLPNQARLRSRRNWKNSTPSRRRRFIMSRSRTISLTIEPILLGRK